MWAHCVGLKMKANEINRSTCEKQFIVNALRRGIVSSLLFENFVPRLKLICCILHMQICIGLIQSLGGDNAGIEFSTNLPELPQNPYSCRGFVGVQVSLLPFSHAGLQNTVQ